MVVDHQFAVPHAELCCGMNEPVAGVKRTNSIARPAGVKERAVVIPCVNWLWLYARSRKQKKTGEKRLSQRAFSSFDSFAEEC